MVDLCFCNLAMAVEVPVRPQARRLLGGEGQGLPEWNSFIPLIQGLINEITDGRKEIEYIDKVATRVMEYFLGMDNLITLQRSGIITLGGAKPEYGEDYGKFIDEAEVNVDDFTKGEFSRKWDEPQDPECDTRQATGYKLYATKKNEEGAFDEEDPLDILFYGFLTYLAEGGGGQVVY